CSEASTPLHPESVYAQSKLDLVGALERQGHNYAWARIFYVYGPGDRAGRLVPHMLDCFARGEPASPRSGALRRDHIHVDDLAGQIVRIALSDVHGAINTGTGEAPILSEIFAVGANALGRPGLALANGETGGQPPLIMADMGRFQREVGELKARDIVAGI